MRRIGLALSAVGLVGCFLSEDSGTKPLPPPGSGDYVSSTAPESVLANLATSHRLREIGPYAALLAPEFVFRFDVQDSANVHRALLTRSEDSVATRALFTSSSVSGIHVQLPHANPIPAAEARFPPGTMVIRVNSPDLQVYLRDGTRWSVSNLQEFYFRPGLAGLGEDPERWFLVEWGERDLIAKPTLPEIPTPEPVRETSWGDILMWSWGGG